MQSKFLAFSSQSCPEVRLLIVAAAATKIPQVSNSFSLVGEGGMGLFLTALCCHKQLTVTTEVLLH